MGGRVEKMPDLGGTRPLMKVIGLRGGRGGQKLIAGSGLESGVVKDFGGSKDTCSRLDTAIYLPSLTYYDMPI